MADIGSTLRETRIRSKIDITSVEEATKIRAKYLRALENEEWVVLPGPTYVKTFIRTYAEFLGLDPRVLVEEYAARFEAPEDLELPAFSREARLRTRVQRVPPPSRWALALAILGAFVVFLLVLGLTGGGDGGGQKSEVRRQESEVRGQSTERTDQKAAAKPKSHSGTVRLTVVAERAVWVCVVDARGRARVDARTLGAGAKAGPFESASFRVTVGNGGARLVIDGKQRDVPERSEPVGYLIKPSGTTPLSQGERPSCG
jgi:hypothetical protein